MSKHEEGSRAPEGPASRYGQPDLSVALRAVNGLLSEQDANLFLGLNPRWGLLNRRRYGTAPAHFRMAGRIFYRVEDLWHFDPRAAGRRGHKAEAPGYNGAHRRVHTFRGSAKLYQCTECDSMAHDWAYLGGCTEERVQRSGKDTGRRYCLHPGP